MNFIDKRLFNTGAGQKDEELEALLTKTDARKRSIHLAKQESPPTEATNWSDLEEEVHNSTLEDGGVVDSASRKEIETRNEKSERLKPEPFDCESR